MNLCIGTYTYPWLTDFALKHEGVFTTIINLLEKAAANNLRFVQIADNAPLHELSSSELADVKEKADQLTIGIEAGTRRLSVDHITKYLALANKLNSPFLRVVIDDSDYHPDEDQVIKVIKELLPELKRLQIILAIENHDRFKARSLESIITATDPDYVGICLDTANSLGAGEGIAEVANVLAPYTVNLHIKDFNIKRVTHKMGFEVSGCAAGKGMLDIPELIQQLRQTGKCKTATLEVWSNPGTDTHASIEQEEAWAYEGINYLRKYIN